MNRRAFISGAGATALLGSHAGKAEDMEQADVFISGRDGYHTYRIPSLLVTARGELLAFCEGRKGGRGDSGDIDLVFRRSADGGRSWGPREVLWDDGPNTVGNPCPVVDRGTGTIHLLLTRNLGEDTEKEIRDGAGRGTREAWVTSSTDDGRTWSPPREITGDVKRPDWTWYATGPGIGIQTRSGRLLIPCDHTVAGSQAMRSHVIYSDDRGKSWKLGGVLGEKTNECQMAELADGSLYLNMRSYHGKNRRAVSRSTDGGLTWSELSLDETLAEPVCQAGLIAFEQGGKRVLLFTNPAGAKRERMTARLSEDGGRTWPVSREIHTGPAAYSCPAVLPDGSLALLYERGDANPYERITLARFSRGWLRGRG